MICYEDYKPDDDVSPLDCHPDHIFHTDCIKKWVKTGKVECPYCKKNMAGSQAPASNNNDPDAPPAP